MRKRDLAAAAAGAAAATVLAGTGFILEGVPTVCSG